MAWHESKADYASTLNIRGANTTMKQKRASTKTAVVSFRIGNEAYDRLNQASAQAGVSTKVWLEEAILNNRTRIVERAKPSADLRTLATQINRMGNNLNQVAHTLNSAQLAGTLSRDECLQAIEGLDHIRALLNETITYARQG
ncbi:plasmid mobilization protein [Nitrosomonas eutropha]|nr:plasmid mobilization relaxosome protein MobC [Nitrosomonas eutropha]